MLENFWYAVAESAAIGRKPSKITALGRDLALYRDEAGRVAALDNLCVHRGGALAMGTVEGDCLRCPYHGWRFDPSGACVEIPANPDGRPIPKKARVGAHPAQERYGWVWIFFGDLPEAERPPIPPLPELGQPGWRALHGRFVWRANYARVVENGLDIAHTPFVHARSFGNRAEPQIDDYTVEGDDLTLRSQVTLRPPPAGSIWRLLRPRQTPVQATLTLHMPNVTRLDLRFGRWHTILLDANLPVDEHTTLTFWLQLRNFFTGRWADRDARRRVEKIFREDQPTVEAQRPELLPFDLPAELHVRSDAMGIAYRELRRRYRDRGWALDPAAPARSVLS